MMLRKLAVGAAALVVGGFTVSAASPAYAQGGDADLEISLVGTTIAQGAEEKFGTLTLTNHGPDDASGIVFSYDTTAFDMTKVALDFEGCTPEPNAVTDCIIEPDGLKSGEHVTFFGLFSVLDGTPGSAGEITVSITHDGTDLESSNDSWTAPVEISEQRGVDLGVWTPDIHNEGALEESEEGLPWTFFDSELLPGSETVLLVGAENQGSLTAFGIELSVTLPKHVSFIGTQPQCSHADGDSSTLCEYDILNLAGTGEPDASCDAEHPCGVTFFFPVKVSDDAPSPASLTGGSAEAWDMQIPQLFTTGGSVELPSNAMPGGPVLDVDPSDNLSFFTVFVGGGDDDGEPGDDGDDSGQGGGDADDEPLPVTGSPVVLISGFGAALLAVGAVLFLVARRRRVVVADSVDS